MSVGEGRGEESEIDEAKKTGILIRRRHLGSFAQTVGVEVVLKGSRSEAT